MIPYAHLALLGFAGVALGACSTRLDAPLSPTLGQAVASMNAQIVPAAFSEEPPEGSAATGVGAVTRYETDKVKALPSTGTSQISIQLGGNGSSKP